MTRASWTVFGLPVRLFYGGDISVLFSNPMYGWNFVRYGVDKPESINALYANEWDQLTGMNYTYHQTSQANVLSSLSDLADTRNDCYAYQNPTDSIYSSDTFISVDLATGAARNFVSQYPSITAPYYRYNVYGVPLAYKYSVDYQPAFLMQMLAYAMSDNGMATFLFVDLPLQIGNARTAIEAYYLSGSLKKPHYLESYYLLSTMIN